MIERLLAIGGAAIIAIVAGSIKNATIVFVGAGIVTLIYWKILEVAVKHK